jgi:RimJ/RimL family protein N-acetyltransferase
VDGRYALATSTGQPKTDIGRVQEFLISTTRLNLRKYVPNDWIRVHLYASIPKFSQFDVWGPNSIEDTKDYVANCIEETSKSPILRHELAVVLKDQDLLIGGCGLKRTNDFETAASLGFAVNPDFQNQGYAAEVAAALIDFGFGTLGLSRIFAECDTRNTASYKVMEKVGMIRVATERDDREVKGVMTDSYRYEITKSCGTRS